MNNVAMENDDCIDILDIEAFRSARLSTQEEKQMAARSGMYALLADLFRYPDEGFREFVKTGGLQAAFAAMAEDLPFDLAVSQVEKDNLVFSPELGDDDIEAGFIRIFEAGPGDPACPLVEGKHVKDSNRRAIFEDLIRFYNHFGLSYDAGSHEDRADHLSYEMEFMHYLAFLTLRAIQSGKTTHDLLLAQRDFLKHHLLKWADPLADRMREIASEVDDDYVGLFYSNCSALVARYVSNDYRYLGDCLD